MWIYGVVAVYGWRGRERERLVKGKEKRPFFNFRLQMF